MYVRALNVETSKEKLLAHTETCGTSRVREGSPALIPRDL